MKVSTSSDMDFPGAATRQGLSATMEPMAPNVSTGGRGYPTRARQVVNNS